MYLLYKITNRINGKAYIGFTKNTLEWRWLRHRTGACPGAILFAAVKKYGKAAFSVEEIGQAPNRTAAATIERALIVTHGTFIPHGYNMTPGGEGNDAPRSERTKERMRQARARLKALGWEVSAEARARQAAKIRGRKRPQSATNAQRAKMIGQKRSDEMRAKMREIAARRSPEQIAKAGKASGEARRRNKSLKDIQLTLDL